MNNANEKYVNRQITDEVWVRVDARLGLDWSTVSFVPQSRLLAGLTSVSDWIGSGEHFEDPSTPWEDNISRALDARGGVSVAQWTDDQIAWFSSRRWVCFPLPDASIY